MRRLALLVGIIAGAVSPARAADVTWQVSVGYGNVARNNTWTPIFVDISNEGPSQTGQIVVPMPLDTPGPVPRFINYALPVDLPQHAKKRYTLYVPYRAFDQITLDLSRFRDRRNAPRVQLIGQNDLLVTVVGGDTGLLSFLSGTKGIGLAATNRQAGGPQYGGPQATAYDQAQVQVGHLDWNGLPDSWIGWDGVGAVVLGDASLSTASSAGLVSLRTWVELGGTLIVPGGALAPALASGPLTELLAADIRGTTTLPGLAELAAWTGKPIQPQPVLIAQLAPRRGAEVMLGSETQPLIVSRRVGSGRVIQTAFDYTSPPVKYWDGQSVLWPRLLTGALPRPSLVANAEQFDPWGGWGPGNLPNLPRAVSTMPEAELPSMWLIIGFLVAYIAVLVPVNYSILNKLDRREWAWISTPAIVVIFTLGAYGLGYGMRGGAIVLNRLGIVETSAGSPVGRGHGYLGLFSPARTSYELALEASATGARDLATADQRISGRATVVAGAKQKITDISMNMWTTRPFGVEYVADLKGGLDGFLEYDGTNLTGYVHNNTGMNLRKVRLVVSYRQGKPIDIAAGGRGRILFNLRTATGVANLPYYQNPHPGVPPPPLEDRAAAALFAGGNPGRLNSGRSFGTLYAPVLLAATKDTHVPAGLSGRKPQVTDATVIVAHLPVRLVLGQLIDVPGWLIPSRVIGAEGSSSYDPYGGGGLQIQQGSIVNEFELPTGGHRAEVASLAFTTLPSGNGGAPPGVLAYDFTHQDWVTLKAAPPAPATPGGGMGGRGGPMMRGRMGGGGGMGGGGAPSPPTKRTVAFPHPQDFVSPDGHVQVKLSAPSGQAQIDSMSLEAKMRLE